ncbi:MAG: hypothetical protein OCU12_07840 [Methanophagales archaeon]|nr:hypothetical protein [Methanophagales archaeon]
MTNKTSAKETAIQETAVTEIDVMPVTGTALEPYGEREEVREMVYRLMKFHPKAQEMGKEVMLSVAQLAILTGANPLEPTQEIQVWDHYGTPRVMLGIAFWRRKAREVDAPVWWIDSDATGPARYNEPRPMTQAERDEHAPGIIGFTAICKCYRLSEYLALLDRNVPHREAARMLVRTGIGVVTQDEMIMKRNTKYNKKGDPKPPPNGRSWQWVAEKRAEQDVYRKLALIAPNEFLQPSDPHPAPEQADPDGISQMDDDDFNDFLFD